ncbi:LPP20 family lipoprotein [Natronoflexus pectinivorans]|uniref:LPP20 lipoprotein n=1 Tax=Natronoflexus pectinivorans TaxID=682526 RepID=A0A4R2GQ13_9BACT|nr:LPP20 family lipoprotein [Natronoflexus pectinivorans]TCO09906.1 LPP20 lipoprotein [Natronoflexus pectinivorans]
MMQMSTKFPYILIAIMLLALLNSCGSARKAEAEFASQPEWLRSRPIDRQYYHGIGSVPKAGSPQLYRDRARQAALDDLAAQIRTQLTSTTTVYQAEDRFGAREFLQSRIETVTNEHLEGYEFVDRWESAGYIHKYYRLSVSEYSYHQNRRRNEALISARTRFEQAVIYEHTFNYARAFSLYTECLELVKDYLHTGTTIAITDDTSVDIGTESLSRLHRISRSLNIKTEIESATEQNNRHFIIVNEDDQPIADVPVRFDYTGSYLSRNRAVSNQQGLIAFPELRTIRDRPERLTATIDLRSMVRQATSDLEIRRLVENWQGASTEVIITSADLN